MFVRSGAERGKRISLENVETMTIREGKCLNGGSDTEDEKRCGKDVTQEVDSQSTPWGEELRAGER